ncbi:MAG TPA: hypothetical protein VIK48_04805, partial [Candidatus Manganitrophaceae bacterium]
MDRPPNCASYFVAAPNIASPSMNPLIVEKSMASGLVRRSICSLREDHHQIRLGGRSLNNLQTEEKAPESRFIGASIRRERDADTA